MTALSETQADFVGKFASLLGDSWQSFPRYILIKVSPTD